MEQAIVDLLTRYGWIGFGILVFLFLLTNSSSTSFFISIIDRFSKTRPTSSTTEYRKFTLLKLIRPSYTGRIWTARIIYILLIVFFIYAYSISITKNLGNTNRVLIYIGVFLSSFSLFETWIKNKVEMHAEFEGNPDDLFRTYQKILFDMNMAILSFDAQNRELKAFLNGNELSIKIVIPENPQNKVEVSFVSERNFVGVVFYSREYINNMRALIKNTCYPSN